MKFLPTLSVACVAVLMVLSARCANAQDTPAGHQQSVRLPITMEADQRTELRARIEGYVAKVHVDIGDQVKKDQILVTLSAPELQAEVRRRKQMVAQAQAHLSVAKGGVLTAQARLRQAGSAREEQAAMRQLRVTQRDRFSMLVQRGAVQQDKLDEAEYAVKAVDAAVAKIDADVQAAQADVQAAKNEVEFAESGIEVAKAELAHAQAQDQQREIKAPFSGLITDRTVDNGQLVSPGNVMGKPLLVVEHVDVLRGVMTVPAAEAELIHVGDQVTLTGFKYAKDVKSPQDSGLKVSRISQSLDRKTRTMRIEIDLKNTLDEKTGRYQFLSGQYGSATVNTKQ